MLLLENGGSSLTHAGNGGFFTLFDAFPSTLVHTTHLRTICFTTSRPLGIQKFSPVEFNVSLIPL